MNREAWRQRTDPETVNKRAAGRRKFNRARQQAQQARRLQVRQALALGYEVWTLDALAAKFGVSMATVCRDLAALGVDLARLRARYEAFDHRPPTYDEVQRHITDTALMTAGWAASLGAKLGIGDPLTAEQQAQIDAARDRILAGADEARARLRAHFGLDDE
jgi:predicted DNA-binding transcriptional regulator YafY